MDKRYLGFFPVPALIVIITALYFAVNPSVFYDPAWLIPITNTLFVTMICFTVAYVAMRNYKAIGRIQILLLGCGVLIFGIGGAIAGFVRGLAGGANLNVTIYNTGALIGAIFHFIAAIILLSGVSPELGSRQRGTWLVAGYPGVIIFMALLTTASLRGVIPPFFIQGVGPTPLRQEILGTADILFIFSFLIFIATYFRTKEVFLYWYALALALTSISLTAFFIESSVGSPVGWAGRFSQYIGGVYFLISLISATRSARDRKTSLDNVLTTSLSSAEETFRALAENSPDVIDRVDKDLKHIYMNPAGLRLYGKPAAAVIGKTMEETGVPETYCILWKERIQKIFETGYSMDVEDYFPTVDGIRFYQCRCVPEYGADGTVANVLVVSHDLTDHKRAEERSSYLASFPQLNSNPIIEIDSSGKVTFCNPAALETLESLGIDKGDVDVFVPPDLDDAVRGWDKRNKTTLYREIIIKDRVYGETIQLVPQFAVARIYANDITHRKKSEESLLQRTAELERVNMELESFIYSASHDLRAPLRTISGFADIVAKRYAGQLDKKGSDYLLRICKGTTRMSRIIDDLLHLSKVSRQEIQRKSVDLSEMASSIIADLRESDPGRQVEVIIRKGLMVHADPGLMEVTLSNLLGNAWKFTSKTENARIEFGAVENNGRTIFFLKDNGAGFDRKYADKMFWPFNRLHMASDFDGTGIGLAIVERVIHRHGGKIWADGEVGKGATISFELD